MIDLQASMSLSGRRGIQKRFVFQMTPSWQGYMWYIRT